jgi:ribosomal protein L11 methyltransferase
MPWLSLTLEVEEAAAEVLSEALLARGAQSVGLEDADEGTAHEAPRFAEPSWDGAAGAWPHSRVVALLPLDANVLELVVECTRAAGLDQPPAFHVERIEDDDWVRRTQSQFTPVPIGERLWIVPTWCEPPDKRAAVVRLDPGMAFGTGTHPSTRLALHFLERSLRGAERVLDYGCGSGILAIAAAKLGAAEVDAVDLDPRALDATRANARANEVSVRVSTPEALPRGDYDVVVANILANPLILLAPALTTRVRAHGRLALSGVLAAQASDVAAAYRPAIELAVAREDEGWVLLEGTRA